VLAQKFGYLRKQFGKDDLYIRHHRRFGVPLESHDAATFKQDASIILEKFVHHGPAPDEVQSQEASFRETILPASTRIDQTLIARLETSLVKLMSRCRSNRIVFLLLWATVSPLD
jgi:hypothetical protein